MEPGAGTQAYIAVGETSPSGGQGGPRGPNGGQGMTPPNDAGGTAAGTANGNPRTPPANADGSTTPPSGDQNGQQSGARPEKTSGGNGQQGGKPTNRESALGIEKGSVITVQDADGRTLYTATALGSMSSVIFSSSDIKEGETYTVLRGRRLGRHRDRKARHEQQFLRLAGSGSERRSAGRRLRLSGCRSE